MSGSLRWRWKVAHSSIGPDLVWSDEFKTLNGAIKRAKRWQTRNIDVIGVFRFDRCFPDRPGVKVRSFEEQSGK